MKQDENIGREAPAAKPQNLPEPESIDRPLTSAELLAGEIRRHRAAARELAAIKARKDPFATPSDLSAAAIVAAIEERTAASRPAFEASLSIVGAMPLQARSVSGQRVVNPKIWSRDVRPVTRRVDSDSWLTRVRSLARARVLGDVLAATIVRISELLVWFHRKTGTGFARCTFDSIAHQAMCSRETARKVVRWLEFRGVLDTFNVLLRRDGEVHRDANLYLLRSFGDVAEWPGRTADDGPAPATDDHHGQLIDRLRRYAGAFGLRARAWGLNATPGADRRRPPPKPSPAPA